MAIKNTVCIVSSYTYIVDNINYGSLFQYYALQTVLKENGCESYWLRYIITKADKDKINIIKSKIKKCFSIMENIKKNKVHKKFFSFIDKYLNVSQKIYQDADFRLNIPDADIYITGSDQVWGGTVPANYLCFVPDEKIKISYAASFGKANLSKRQYVIVKSWLKRLDAISVREKSGVGLCHSMGIKAELVLDPTLLIDRSQYPIGETTKQMGKKYMFGYFLNAEYRGSIYYKREILQYINKNNYDLYITGGVAINKKIFGGKHIGYYSPEEWLRMYADAKGIFTNSYHGTIFSIIFHKPFIVFLQTGESCEQNERMISILEYLGLTDRIYAVDKTIEDIMKQEIKWKEVERKIEIGKSVSKKFIRRMVL